VRALLISPLLGLLSCGWNAAGTTGCRPLGPAVALPPVLQETSGVAWSRIHPDVLFSHNDSGHDPILFALDMQGNILGEIPVAGGRNQDWEDLAVGRCPTGTCLYVADVGDNGEVRDHVTLYRVPDPGVYDGTPVDAESFPMALPHGPRDMESLLVLPGEEILLITKGRSDGVTVLRYPPPLRSGETVILETVQRLTDDRLSLPRQITGADASPDGSLVAIRSYESLRFYRWDGGRLVPLAGGTVALRTLHEAQGEGVGLGPRGRVALTSEGALGESASLTILDCRALGGRP